MTERSWPRRRAVLAALVCLTSCPALAGPTVTMPPDTVRHEMRQALAAGDAPTAWHLAQALLQAGVHRYDALIALAEAERRLGRPAAARRATQQAATLASTPKQRFETALLRAYAAEDDGAAGALVAQFWTRRAIQLAPMEAHRAAAIGELGRMRASAPLHLQLSFTAAPSSNVNNGSRETHITAPSDLGGGLWQLAPQARALSGFVAEAGISARYRLQHNATSATHLRFAAQRREVQLSRAARDQIEAWRQQQIAFGLPPPAMPNYDYGALEAGVTRSWRSGPQRYSLGATFGHAWFGGADLEDYMRLEASGDRALSQTTVLFAGLSAERHWRKPGTGQDSDILALQTGVQHQIASGDTLRFALSGRNLLSGDVNQRHQAVGLRLGWEKAAPVAGLRLSASLGAEARHYDASALAPGGRRDLRLDAGLSLEFQRMDYMGFVPVVSLSANKVNSTLALYKGHDTGISFGFRSRF